MSTSHDRIWETTMFEVVNETLAPCSDRDEFVVVGKLPLNLLRRDQA